MFPRGDGPRRVYSLALGHVHSLASMDNATRNWGEGRGGRGRGQGQRDPCPLLFWGVDPDVDSPAGSDDDSVFDFLRSCQLSSPVAAPLCSPSHARGLQLPTSSWTLAIHVGFDTMALRTPEPPPAAKFLSHRPCVPGCSWKSLLEGC